MSTLTRPATGHIAAAADRPHPGRRLHRAERRAGVVFVLPAVVLFAVFVGYPILQAFYLSLTSWNGFGTPAWVGLDNFVRMVGDPVAMRAMRTTVLFALVTTALQTAIPLLVAVVVKSTWRTFGVVVRTLLFIPGVVSFVITGVLWRLILDPNVGTLNRSLRAVGLDGLAHSWLGDGQTALWVLMGVSLWQSMGLMMLIYFAGLQGIDPTLYEAAEIDGAGPVQRLRFVTVPSLRVVTAIVVSLNLMNGFKTFDLVYVMTQGGPNHATEVLGTQLYGLAFGSTSGSIPQMGYASSISVLVMALCTLGVVVQILLNRRATR